MRREGDRRPAPPLAPALADVPPEALSTSWWARGPKRAVDLLLALAGLVIVSPVLLAAMAAVKLTSRGPVFFTQPRTGRGGRPFVLYKLRTMRGGRRPDPQEIVPLDHPEVTRVGRVLRRWKIDELPQIFNVIRGDMALVGPRPTLPEQTRLYDAWAARRLLVRPGITGLAQVNGGACIPWPERIRYDVYYVRHHDLLMDLGILLKTLAVVIRGEARFARPFAQTRYATRDSSGAAPTTSGLPQPADASRTIPGTGAGLTDAPPPVR